MCGAEVIRCADCGTAVAPSRVRRGDSCPRHPGAETVPGRCEQRLKSCEVRCRYHGAESRQAKAKAAERNVDGEVQRLLHEQGWEPVTDPLEALADLLGEVAATKAAFLDRVDELRGLTVEDSLGREDVRAVLAGYERALDRQGRLLVDAARLNLDERIVAMRQRVEEWQMAAIGDVIEAALADVLPLDLEDAAKRRFGQRMRALMDGTPLPPLTSVPAYVRADAERPVVAAQRAQVAVEAQAPASAPPAPPVPPGAAEDDEWPGAQDWAPGPPVVPVSPPLDLRCPGSFDRHYFYDGRCLHCDTPAPGAPTGGAVGE